MFCAVDHVYHIEYYKKHWASNGCQLAGEQYATILIQIFISPLKYAVCHSYIGWDTLEFYVETPFCH